ncbi:hypothetical protein AQJ27_49025 [Streptomyces olivochromogenes]|nr:hypothetical protein AQJ27_49025 [Streptomyces olivochromogenes]
MHLPHPGQLVQGFGVVVVCGLPEQGFGALPVPGLLPHLGQAVQDVGAAAVGDLPGQGFGALPVPGLLPHLGQAEQSGGAAVGGGAVAEVVGPLQAVAFLGCLGEVAQVVGVDEVGVGGVPEGGMRAQVAAGGAAVLFEVVGEPELWSRSRRGRCFGGGGGRRAPWGAGGVVRPRGACLPWTSRASSA